MLISCGPRVADVGHLACVHPSGAAVAEPSLLPIGVGKEVGLAMLHMTHVTKQTKEVHSVSEMGKDIPTQIAKSSTGCKDNFPW